MKTLILTAMVAASALTLNVLPAAAATNACSYISQGEDRDSHRFAASNYVDCISKS